MLKKSLLLATILSAAGCATSNKPITPAVKNNLNGAEIKYVVKRGAKLASSIDGASFFGALGQKAKGTSLQKTIGLTDPSNNIAEQIKNYLKATYNTSEGEGYTVTFETTYMWLGDPAGDDLTTLAMGLIVDMKMTNSASEVLAKGTCNTSHMMNDPSNIYLTAEDLKQEAFPLVKKSLHLAGENCIKQFKALL